jgi:hypothetical protein
VHTVVVLAAKPVYDSEGNAHVAKESHSSRLRDNDLLLSKPCRVLDGLLHVGTF